MSIIVINYYKMQSGRNTVLTGFSSDLRFASQSPPANFKAAKRRSVFRLDQNQEMVHQNLLAFSGHGKCKCLAAVLQTL